MGHRPTARFQQWIQRRTPTPTAIYDTYWRFASERQEIFCQRLRGEPPPWSSDPALTTYRFTNPYRATDRVSQYLIRSVAYDGDQDATEVAFRVLLFKLFNKIETWELLSHRFSLLSTSGFDIDAFDATLTAARRDQAIYSAAYIIPPAGTDFSAKHTSHLHLLHRMLADKLPESLMQAGSMSAAYEALRYYRGIGSFLAYQFLIDLNYTDVIDFSEMAFVLPGPGARSGLRKCFSDPGDYDEESLIRRTTETQVDEFAQRRLPFKNLWGRPLQLIDCQNLYCEVDKYSRMMHPESIGMGNRTQLKRRFKPRSRPTTPWLPPKWGMNERIQEDPVLTRTRTPSIDAEAREGRDYGRSPSYRY